MFGGAFSGFGGQLFGNWRYRAKRRFRATVDPLAFSRFWAFLENFEGATGLEPPVFPLLLAHNQSNFEERWGTSSFPIFPQSYSDCVPTFGHEQRFSTAAPLKRFATTFFFKIK